MEIGVISDTHGLVRKEVFSALDGVDLILHAGDIGGMDVIAELEAIAPVRAVVGNNDADLFGRFKEHADLEFYGKKIELRHYLGADIPQTNGRPETIRKIVIFGHSHQPADEHVGTTLYFNPGSAGPRRFKLPITLGRLTLTADSLTRKIISLE
jgi:hypothetical protein